MIAIQRHSDLNATLKAAIALAGTVTLAMTMFGSALAVMDHVSAEAQRSTIVRSGTFGTSAQGDYQAVVAPRIPPQRKVTW